MSRTITIFNTDESCEWWAFRLPDYSEKFRDRIKTTVPVHERNYDPADQIWSVQEKWKRVIANLAQECFPGADLEEEEY